VVEQALREKAELEAQVEYLQSQLGEMLQEKGRNLRSSRSASKQADSNDSEEEESNSRGDSGEDVYATRSRRHHRPHDRSCSDFKVDIPEFEGQLDSDLFLDWL